MEKRTYFCDKCKKEVESKECLKPIVIGCGNQEYTSYGSIFDIYKTFELCLECQEKIGIVKTQKLEPKEIDSIKEKLYDIVADLVNEAMNNR